MRSCVASIALITNAVVIAKVAIIANGVKQFMTVGLQGPPLFVVAGLARSHAKTIAG